MDFTIEKYKELLGALKKHKSFSIRHDVDLRPDFSLRVAQVEAEEGLTATYYFRTVPESYDENIIQQIVSLGHRAGYHYECLTTCNGDMEAAYDDFGRNLEKLRKVVPITTACAHGSPRSPWNSQLIWEPPGRCVTNSLSHNNKDTLSHPATQPLSHPTYDIHALGIEYEPMLDTDFSKTLYLTDTGRRWDGYKVSVRDKVPQYQEMWEQEGLVFHSTDDIIHALSDIHHPIHKKALLINTHPQRWMPFGGEWMATAAVQWWKNAAKRLIVWNMERNGRDDGQDQARAQQ